MTMGVSRFRVVVYREVDLDWCSADADVVVAAERPVEAASMVLRSIGGGYADYVGVSAHGDTHVDAYGFVEEVCFMYCTSNAGEFSYDARL
jgi:hypothetical protein